MAAKATGGAHPPRSRWVRLIWVVPSILVGLAAVVIAARLLRTTAPVEQFIAHYPGEASVLNDAPSGFPAWMSWQHFLNALFLVLIVRSGWLVRTQSRPPAFWTRKNTGVFRSKRPPKKISITLWLHLSLDVLWIANGMVFIVLLFATRQWMRIVPTSWDVFPNALSTAVQYASLDWPVHDSWANYNALQLLAYFVTVFIAAPVAVLTGLRMSPAWPSGVSRLNRLYPVELARAVHFPTMLYFVLFAIVHVALVFSTGALHNLNHMYADRNDGSWIGFWIFAGSVVAIAACWTAARPLILHPIAALSGRVGR